MSKRNLIRNQIRQAWDLTIDDEYEKVLINSERGLQTYFCMHLLNIFKDEGVQRRIFIEPNLKIGEMIRYPDLVVCNTREVIAVIELKYTPRALPRTAKDFETLRWVSEADGEAIIANERFHDQQAVKPYAIAKDSVLCWAALISNRPFNPDKEALNALGDRFLDLSTPVPRKTKPSGI
jgi:hypothetical protein